LFLPLPKRKRLCQINLLGHLQGGHQKQLKQTHQKRSQPQVSLVHSS
jgi:hypothetical protein